MPKRRKASELSAEIGQMIDEKRKENRQTLPEIATIAGLSLSSVNRYLRGQANIDVHDLEPLCRAVGLNPVNVYRDAHRRVNS